MKRIFFYIALLSMTLPSMAAPKLDISDVYFNDEYDSWGVDISLENGDSPVSVLQFDIALPSEFNIVNNAYHFTKRAQILEGVKYVDTHSCDIFTHDNGMVQTFIFSFSGYNIQESQGKLIFMEVQKNGSNANKSEHYPCNLVNQLIIINDEDLTPLYPEAIINDENIRCYDAFGNHLTAWGEMSESDMSAFNLYLRTNDRSTRVDLRKCSTDNVGMLDTANPNTMIMAASEAQVDNAENVFWDETDGLYCNKLSLYDEAMAVEIPFEAKAKSFSFNRMFKAGRWSTIALPVALTDEQFEELTADGTIISSLASYDSNTAQITYQQSGQFLANYPYAIKAATDKMIDFDSMIDIKPTADSMVSAGNLSMQGNLDYSILCSDNTRTCYGYDESSGIFRMVGKNVILKPFRCYLSLPVVENVSNVLYINISDTIIPYVPTAIDTLSREFVSSHSPEYIYNISGQKESIISFGISIMPNGKKVIR